MVKEDGMLLAALEDKIDKSEAAYMVTNSTFLDMRQRTLAEALCKKRRGLHYLFYGGFVDAERKIALFLPDYIATELLACSSPEEYFLKNQEDNPLTLLRILQRSQKTLTHRDYLGSLTGLGLKREVMGDILVREDGADVIILKEIAEFLLYNYEKAGRANLECRILPLERLIIPEGRIEEVKDTVASLRLDNLVASAFKLSRGKAAEAITGGMVFVNGLQSEKTDKPVNQGDKLVLRGKGKVVLKTVGNTTKKDRIFIVLDRYL